MRCENIKKAASCSLVLFVRGRTRSTPFLKLPIIKETPISQVGSKASRLSCALSSREVCLYSKGLRPLLHHTNRRLIVDNLELVQPRSQRTSTFEGVRKQMLKYLQDALGKHSKCDCFRFQSELLNTVYAVHAVPLVLPLVAYFHEYDKLLNNVVGISCTATFASN